MSKSKDSRNNTSRREFLKKGAALSALPMLGSVAGVTPAIAAGFKRSDGCLELPPDNAEKYNMTCQYCMVQCGYHAYVWERGKGKIVKGNYTGAMSGEWVSPNFVAPAEKNGKKVYVAVIPDSECVVNQGAYSIRGGTNAQTIFSKNLPSAKERLTTPMIRKGGKNSPLVPVSWDEAIEFTARNLQKLKREHGPDALGLIWGDWLYSLNTHAMLKLWFEKIGSSSHAGNGWFFDEESAGMSAAFGTGTRSFTVQDFDETKLLVTAGTNLMSNGTTWYGRFYANMTSGGARQIDIDPRRTPMSRHAEENGGVHLMLKPGTDAILVAALIRIIIQRDAYDKAFVAENVSGFDVLRRVVMNRRFSLSNASRATGVPKEKILKAADLLIEARGRSMLLSEKGIMHQLGAFEHQHGYAALGAILGNVGRVGATTSRAGGHPGGTFAWPKEPPSRANNKNIYDSIQKGKIKAIWAFGCNILKQAPALALTRPNMEKSFLIVQDRIKTEMNDFADVVFPAATWGERDGVLTSVDRRVRMHQTFMDPPGKAKPDWWIVAQVAKKMGYSGFDWDGPEDVWKDIQKIADDIKDISWDKLNAAGTNGIQLPYVNGKSIERLFSDEYKAAFGKRFPTKDGKIHLEKTALLGAFNPKANEWSEVDNKYPLMAIDFRLNELWNTGYTYWDKPTVNQRTPDAYLMIHPSDARSRGVRDGQWVKLKSRYGECRAKARVTENIIAGTVGMPTLFPKKGQDFNYVTPPKFSPINGDHVTMVAVDVFPA